MEGDGWGGVPERIMQDELREKSLLELDWGGLKAPRRRLWKLLDIYWLSPHPPLGKDHIAQPPLWLGEAT